MSAHTPAPWPIKGWSAGDSRGWQIRVGRHENAPRLNLYDESQSSEHDARLIAAAPELLEALELLVREEAPAIDQPEWKRARAAIAKARGGQ